LGWRYFTERRGLHIGALGDLSHTLRWNARIRAVVALMTDPLTNKPTGVHRTLLNSDATKHERKMLGRQGVIRLSRDDEVHEGLGLVEGVEDGLAVLLSGWAPVWAPANDGGIARFPVLAVESLTIFADADSPGMKSAHACAKRWTADRHEVCILPAKDYADAAA
jgi:Toprim domain